MRTLMLSLVLVALVCGLAFTGEAQTTSALAHSKSYANSATHTLSVGEKFGVYNRVSAVLTIRDSASGKIYVDTRPPGGSTWTVKDSLSVSTTSNTGTIAEWVLRDHTTERAPGVANDTRFRCVWADSGNGVTSPTYDFILQFR
jgi:hypothetical protein